MSDAANLLSLQPRFQEGLTIINNSIFTDNDAVHYGGAIYVNKNSPNCKVINSNFTLNYVEDVLSSRGGVIDWLGANGTIYNSTFSLSYAIVAGSLYIASDNISGIPFSGMFNCSVSK